MLIKLHNTFKLLKINKSKCKKKTINNRTKLKEYNNKLYI